MARIKAKERERERTLIDEELRVIWKTAPGVRGVYDRHGYRAEMQRAFEALAMQIQQILHPQDDVTQLDACHA